MPIPARPRTVLGVLAALLFATVLATVATAALGSGPSPSAGQVLDPSPNPSPSQILDPSPNPSPSPSPSQGPELSLTGTGDITVTGGVDRGQGRSYTFGLAAGLKVAIAVTSTADNVRVTVIDPDGKTLAADEVSATVDKASAGTWTFRVTSRADAARYTLHITAT